MFPTGPTTVILNTIQPIELPQTTAIVEIENKSRYDLWVSFYPTQPSPPAGSIQQAYWHLPVRAWTTKTVTVHAPPQGIFTGKVWIYPVNRGGSAASGTISSLAEFYVTGYDAGEAPVSNFAVAANTDLTSQPRVIAIPTEPHISGAASKVFTALNSPAAIVQIASGINSNTSPITVYLYSLIASITGGAWALVEIDLYDVDIGQSLLATHVLDRVRLTVEHGAYPIMPPSASPLNYTPHNLTAFVWLGATILAAYPNPATNNITLDFDAKCDVDLTGQTPPPAIGNGAGTPSGAVY